VEAAEPFAGPSEEQPAETTGEPDDDATGTVVETQAETVSEVVEAEAPADGEQADDDTEGDPKSIAAEVEVDEISESLSVSADAETAASGSTESESTEMERAGELEEVHHAGDDHDHEVESVGAEDALEEVRNRRKPPRRHYKIQEVIK